jgi:hypothetical protein
METLITLAFLLVRWNKTSETLIERIAIRKIGTLSLLIHIPKIIQMLIPLCKCHCPSQILEYLR